MKFLVWQQAYQSSYSQRIVGFVWRSLLFPRVKTEAKRNCRQA